MRLSNAISALLSGVIATFVMTALIYILPRIGLPQLDIITILGALFTSDANLAMILGLLVHLFVGAFFGLIYLWFWRLGVGAPDGLWGLVFGALHGLIALLVLPNLLNIHPHPPEIELGLPLTMVLLVSHLVYGLALILNYLAMTRPLARP